MKSNGQHLPFLPYDDDEIISIQLQKGCMRKIVVSFLFFFAVCSSAEDQLLVLGADPLQVGPSHTLINSWIDGQKSQKNKEPAFKLSFTQGHKVTDDILKMSNKKF